VVLAFIVLVSSFLFWFLIKLSFNQASNEEWIFRILLSSASFVILGSFIGLFCLLEDKKMSLLGLITLMIAPFFMFFGSLSWYKLGFLLLAFLFFWRGVFLFRQEKEARIKLVLAEILMKGLASVITGLVLLVSVGFYGSLYAQSLVTAEITMPRDFFDKVIDSLLMAPDTLKKLSASQGANQTKQKLAEENKEIKDSFYQQLNKYLNTTGNFFKKILPFGLATTLFFVLRFWGAILMRLSAMLAWAWFGLLRLLRLVHFRSINVEKEIIEI